MAALAARSVPSGAVPLVPLVVTSQVQAALDRVKTALLEDDTRASESSLQSPAGRLKHSFKFYIGGTLQVPSNAEVPVPADPVAAAAPQQRSTEPRDPFSGLPFQQLAESLGERIMPALKEAQTERRATRMEAMKMRQAPMAVPEVPSVFPLARWAANSQRVRDTLVHDPTQQKKARLSWYHPDDTMVPRDWLKGGLLADLRYYNPFGRA